MGNRGTTQLGTSRSPVRHVGAVPPKEWGGEDIFLSTPTNLGRRLLPGGQTPQDFQDAQ